MTTTRDAVRGVGSKLRSAFLVAAGRAAGSRNFLRSPVVRVPFALCLLAPGLAGCYSERLPPPNYRYACDGDADCPADERCIDGRCHVPCFQASAEHDCPSSEGFATCFNGVCVSTCELPREVCVGDGDNRVCDQAERQSTCTEPQLCLDLGIDFGGGGNVFGGPTDVELGICGQWCTEGSCPEGETCLAGFCVATCDPAGPDTCNTTLGLTCQDGLCRPDLDGAPSTDTDAPARRGTSMATTGPSGNDGPTSESTASEGATG